MKKVMHPGGFRKITLFSLFGFRLRLHIWNGFSGDLEDPHQHRWLLVSLPLWGKFQDYRWQETEGSNYKVCSATPYSQGGGTNHYQSNLTHVRNVDLKLVDLLDRYPFIPYTCKADDIHSYRPLSSRFHASLVMTMRTNTPVGYVYQTATNRGSL